MISPSPNALWRTRSPTLPVNVSAFFGGSGLVPTIGCTGAVGFFAIGAVKKEEAEPLSHLRSGVGRLIGREFGSSIASPISVRNREGNAGSVRPYSVRSFA